MYCIVHNTKKIVLGIFYYTLVVGFTSRNYYMYITNTYMSDETNVVAETTTEKVVAEVTPEVAEEEVTTEAVEEVAPEVEAAA
jgi:hypothetical protein